MLVMSKPYPATKSQRSQSGVTPFRFKVYDALLMIPPGKVTTYGLLAKYLNTSPRAVGGALRHNPYAPYIPCHRVIAGDYFVGGFSGAWGAGETIDKKRALLAAEGVSFDAQGYVPVAARDKCIYRYPEQ